MRLLSLLFPILLAVIWCQPALAGGQNAAKEIHVIQSFDPQQYIGTWYEIARLDNRFEQGLEQVTANYSVNDDGTIKVIHRGFNPRNGEWKETIGRAEFVDTPNPDGTRTGRLKVTFTEPAYETYNLIELDKPYYNYALVSSGKEYLWILSRTPQLTYPIKQHLMAKAKELGFATHELLFVKQANQVEYEAGRHVIPQHN